MIKMNRKYEDKFFPKIIFAILTRIFLILFRPKIEGKDIIPKTGRIILAGTHTNNLDCILLGSCTKRNIHFLAKKELWQGPKKIIFSHLGLIPVDRSKKDHNCLIEAKKYLENEKIIGIFPEGTIEKEYNVLLPFKIGAVKLAKDTDTKIIPFAISGHYKILFNDLHIKFAKPITIVGNLEEENERLKNIINEIRGE